MSGASTPRVETALGWQAPASDGKTLDTRAFLARQPILDQELATRGYELLYRSGATNAANIVDPIQATSTVLVRLLADFGIERVVGSVPAWVNFPAEYLTARAPVPIPTSGLVIEVLQGFPPTARLLHRLRQLKREGCEIALDDFEFRPELEPFLALADYVKLSVLGQDMAVLEARIAQLRPFGARLVATRVETMADFEACKARGFALFQGYFVTKPQLLEGNKTLPIRVGLSRLMAELHAPSPDLRKLERLVAQDAGLSLQLLRFLNSSVYALPRKVESISHAVMMLGVVKLKNLLGLLQVNQVEDRPPALVEMALVRGKTVERLAANAGLSAESGFTVGLFSVLDALLDQPMEKVLADLPLHADLRQALTAREGPYGRFLAVVEAQEQGDEARIAELGIDPTTLTEAWLESVAWSRTVSATLGGESPSTPA